MCSLRLAVNRPRKDGQDQGAVFIDVVSFSRQSEAVAEHLGKGRQVAVTGRLEYRQWVDPDGSPHSRHSVVANQIDFLAKPATNSTTEPQPVYSDEEPFEAPRGVGAGASTGPPRFSVHDDAGDGEKGRATMDMAEQLDEITYNLLACATDEDEARQRLEIVAYWAQQQQARLDAGAAPRVDHSSVVAEAVGRGIQDQPSSSAGER